VDRAGFLIGAIAVFFLIWLYDTGRLQLLGLPYAGTGGGQGNMLFSPQHTSTTGTGQVQLSAACSFLPKDLQQYCLTAVQQQSQGVSSGQIVGNAVKTYIESSCPQCAAIMNVGDKLLSAIGIKGLFKFKLW
jgi:hypothetical protein